MARRNVLVNRPITRHRIVIVHECALHGFFKVALDTLARLITRRTEPHVKLH